MSSWRDLADRALSEKSASTVEVASDLCIPAAYSAVRKDVHRSALDPAIGDHIEQLRHRPPPRLRPETQAAWRGVIDDAFMLVVSGWAERAMLLEWSVSDLFGLSAPDTSAFEGLAVWLRGRRLVLIDEQRAIAVDAAGGRHLYHRGRAIEAGVQVVMLWQFGRRS